MSEYPEDLRELVDGYLERLTFSDAPVFEKLNLLRTEVTA